MQYSSMEDLVSDINANSREWRSKEARDMFVLLLEEYENSKRLSPYQRYREWERIISMFTADPVLDKLKWLSEENVDNDRDDDDVPSDEEFISDDLENDNVYVEPSISTAIGKQMRRFASKLKTLSSWNTPTSHSSSRVSSSSNTTTSPRNINDASVSSSCNKITSSTTTINTPSTTSSSTSLPLPNYSNDIHDKISTCINNSNSAPSTPVSKPYPACLHHNASVPSFSKFHSGSMSSSMSVSPPYYQDTSSPITPISNHTMNNSANRSNDSLNKTDNYFTFPSTTPLCSSSYSPASTDNRRKCEFDKYLITQNQIPDFEIPTRKTCTSKNGKIDPNTIEPSLYIVSTRSSLSSEEKKFRHQNSYSVPTKGQYYDRPGSPSPKGMYSKLRRAFRRDHRNKNDFEYSVSDGSESSSFDIKKGHSLLLKYKHEYAELDKMNVVCRYVKMKRMLKSCNTLDNGVELEATGAF